VGLPGLVCAQFAGEMIITDFVDSLVENLKYNLSINTAIEDGDLESKDPEVERKTKIKQQVKKVTRIGYLDWGEVEKKEKVSSEPSEDEDQRDESSFARCRPFQIR